MSGATENPTTASPATPAEAHPAGSLEHFILEEGPLSAREFQALPEACREDYLQAQQRRLARLGREEYCRWVRRHSGRAPQPETPTLRPIDDQLLGIVLDYFEQRYHARSLR